MNVTSDWHGYTNACWAANWHRLFAGDPSDARGRMGWPGRFADALTNATEVFNNYSSGDAVFTETPSVPSLLEGARTWHLNWFLWVIPYPTVEFTFENHCWQKQEVLKGTATLAGTLSGGWGFNVWQEYDDALQRWEESGTPFESARVAQVDKNAHQNRPRYMLRFGRG